MDRHYVLLTSGSYSNYSLGSLMCRPVDPQPVIDAAVSRLSGGRWSTQQEMVNDRPYGRPEIVEVRRIGRLVVEGFEQALKDAGFVPVDFLEVWADF